MSRFIASADLGQLHDPTAICVAEVTTRHDAWMWACDHQDEPPMIPLDPTLDFAVDAEGTGRLINPHGVARLAVRHMERHRGKSYPEIIRRLADLMRRPPLAPTDRTRGATLLIDATGVGRPIVEQIREARIPNVVGITITSARAESHHPSDFRDYLVPKRLLIQTVDMLMHREALKVAALGEQAENLQYELNDFRYRVDPESGYESYSARSGEHDDMVLSIAQACWFATIPERTVIATTLEI